MTPLRRGIAEEIATDHVDGLLSRRDALRRLALLGMGTAAATTTPGRYPYYCVYHPGMVGVLIVQ